MITQERVKELFVYDNGKLFWLVNRGKAKSGDQAGAFDGRYFSTTVDGKSIKTHRLIFLYHHGYLPENQIDHIDRNVKNNKIENLREVVVVCNQRNTGNRSDNVSGVKGVYFSNKHNKWIAQIKVYGRNINLGVYFDFAEAVCHRLAAEQAEKWEGCDSTSPAYLYVKRHIKGQEK